MAGEVQICPIFTNFAAQTTNRGSWYRQLQEECKCELCGNIAIEAVELKCGHVFGEQCLESYLSKRHSCPCCRAEAKISDAVPCYTVRRRVADLSFVCRSCGQENLRLNELSTHPHHCRARTMKETGCPYAMYGCKTFFPSHGLPQHMDNEVVKHGLLTLQGLDTAQASIAQLQASINDIVTQEVAKQTNTLRSLITRLQLELQDAAEGRKALENENLRLDQLIKSQAKTHKSQREELKREMAYMQDKFESLKKQHAEFGVSTQDARTDITLLQNQQQALKREGKKTRVDTYEAMLQASAERRQQVTEYQQKLVASTTDQMAAFRDEVDQKIYQTCESLKKDNRIIINRTETTHNGHLEIITADIEQLRGVVEVLSMREPEKHSILKSRMNLLEKVQQQQRQEQEMNKRTETRRDIEKRRPLVNALSDANSHISLNSQRLASIEQNLGPSAAQLSHTCPRALVHVHHRHTHGRAHARTCLRRQGQAQARTESPPPGRDPTAEVQHANSTAAACSSTSPSSVSNSSSLQASD